MRELNRFEIERFTRRSKYAAMMLALAGALSLAGCGAQTTAETPSEATKQISKQLDKQAAQHSAPAGFKTLSVKDIGPPSQVWGEAKAAPRNYTLETVIDKIDHPWSLAFLPDGEMLVTERSGHLKSIGRDGRLALVKDFGDIAGAPVHTSKNRQAGLFDILLDPDFENNRQLFISYAAKTEGNFNTLVVRRFTYKDGVLDAGTQIFAANPARTQSNHYGGRMIFLPDGTLMIPHGEASRLREKAQTLDNHFGKILRINKDGSVPKDNPFIGQDGVLPEIWSYGHRNPQGIILASNGQVYANEHGARGGDEINLIKPGVNYGWPAITYGTEYSGGTISPFGSLPSMRQSLVHFVPSIAPAGMVQYSGAAFPELEGDLLIPALVQRHIRHVEMNADGSLGEQSEMFGELGARFRDVRVGPDGYIYLLIEEKTGPNGKIMRAVPK